MATSSSACYLLCAALAATLLLGTVQVVEGHAGHLHAYPNTPEGNNYIRYLQATAGPFQPLSATAEIGVVPIPAPDAPVITITGPVQLWTYLNKNCTDVPSAAIVSNIVLTDSAGMPLVNASTYGYAYLGNCSDPGDLYRDSVTMGDADTNLLWWKAYKTDGNGTINGSAYQPFKLRATELPLSVVFIPYAGATPLCSNLMYTAPPPASFYTQGERCNPLPPAPPRPPKYVYRKWKGWKAPKPAKKPAKKN